MVGGPVVDKTRGQLGGEIDEVCVAIGVSVTNLTVSDRGGTKGREDTPDRGKRFHVHVVLYYILTYHVHVYVCFFAKGSDRT